jgi:CBS domain containing-hemolysin-like protein
LNPHLLTAAATTGSFLWSDFLLLAMIVVVALVISFLCSILEAALLSTRTMELTARRDHGDRGATRLLEIKQHRLDDAISAILTLNTISHTFGAALSGWQAANTFGDAWVGWFTFVLTLLILVVTEIIPKTLGATYASKLVPFIALTLRGLLWIFTPILFLTRSLTRLFAPKGHENVVSRGEVAALIALAAQQGAFRDHEIQLVENVLRFDSITVADVMTPRTVVRMLPSQMPLRELLQQDSQAFSRIPLTEGTRDQVTSYVLHRELLWEMAQGGDLDRPLSDFARPVWSIAETESVGRALRQLIDRNEHLALVADEFGGVSGLVTLEDLVETILGVEILDESDEVADLRTVAAELRDRRLARMHLTERERKSQVEELREEATTGTAQPSSSSPEPPTPPDL